MQLQFFSLAYLHRLLSPASCLLFFYPIVAPIFFAFCCTRPNRFAICASKQIQKYSLSAHRAGAHGGPKPGPGEPFSVSPKVAIHRFRFPHMQIEINSIKSLFGVAFFIPNEFAAVCRQQTRQ